MKHILLSAAVLSVLASFTLAQVDNAAIQRAANGVVRLRSAMKDPDSFVLEAAYLKKPDKHGRSEICFYYRAHNSYGGYTGTGETVLLKNDRFFDIDAQTQANPFFGLLDPCRPSTRVADITADVLSTFNPAQT